FSSAGDPIILYDQEVNRWLITEFPSGSQLLVAISQTDDPLGAWDAYNFATPSFPDYPKYGIWGDTYTVTTNEGGPGTLHAYFIDREAILNTEAMVSIQRISLPGYTGSEGGFLVATPVDWTGANTPNSDPLLVTLNDSSWGAGPEDAIEIYAVDVDFDNPDNTTVSNTTVPTSPFDAYACAAPGFGFACVPQLNGGGLDGIPEVVMNQAVYRNFGSYEAMVMCHMTDANGNDLAGIRWVEMRRSGASDWELFQEGTWAPDDSLHRFMSSVQMDDRGNIALGYNVSSEDTYVGVRFTGRRASDPLGEMSIPEIEVVEGQSTVFSGGRFGDYAHMSVDPVDDRTFWYTTEYAGPSNVRTRIISFVMGKDTTDLAVRALVNPVSAAELTTMETVSVEVRNFGLDTIESFSIGYVFEGAPAVIDQVTQTILPDSNYIHTFGPTVDMSTIGDYEFTLFATAPDDDLVRNDTLGTVVSHLARFDASASAINISASLLCGDSFPLELEVTNLGTDTLTSLTVELSLNGTPLDPITWEGSLESGASTNLTAFITGAIDGLNTLVITTANPNGVPDQRPDNDSFTRELEVLLDGVDIFLNILTDEYPNETTWEISNENGVILYEGGPYSDQFTEIQERFCLDPDECYTFTIFDSFGDGICCQFGEGNYEFTDADGLPLLTSTGEFGDSETNDFCATFTCTLAGEVEVALESSVGAEDGTIMVFATDGVGPFTYSIDGGTTFSEGSTFTGLAAGEYEIIIAGAGDCTYSETVVVGSCTLEFLTATVMGESTENANDGQIEIAVENGVPPYTYTLNGDSQDNPLFENLEAGDYTMVVEDSLGCTVTVDIMLDIINSTETITIGSAAVLVYPNPTLGVFRVELPGLEVNSVFLPIKVYDAKGSLLYDTQLPQYNGRYTGQLSLYAYPDGVYYLRFMDDRIEQMTRVIKTTE
ncbi:MAG: T9SS type A sorting domain-containing protein, partial [Bacteroidota bacterium]